MPTDLALGVDVHQTGQGEPVDLRIQRTDAIGQPLRQHRHDAVGQIDRGGPFKGLPLQGAALAHVVADVGDVHTQAPAALGQLLHADGVVQILGVGPVHRDDLPVAQVTAPGDLLRCHGLRDGLRLRQRLLAELLRQAELADDGEDVHPGRAFGAQALDHLALGAAPRLRPTGDLDHDHLAAPGAVGLAGGHGDVVRQAAVVGADVARLLRRLKGADDAQVAPLKDADDLALGPVARAYGHQPRHNAVAVPGAAQVLLADEQVVLTLGVGNQEAEALGVTLQPPHHEVHPLRRAVALRPGTHNQALSFHLGQKPQELGSLCLRYAENLGQLSGCLGIVRLVQNKFLDPLFHSSPPSDWPSSPLRRSRSRTLRQAMSSKAPPPPISAAKPR